MQCAASPAHASSYLPILVASVLIAACILGSTGCGGGSSSMTPPKFSGNTNVTVVMSSTANDQLTQFDIEFQTLTLTSQSGKTVPLLSAQQPSEFMHLNGEIEPLTTVTVPQDIYTSATVTLAGARYVCVAQVPSGGLGISNYSLPTGGPKVNLPSPITITGNNMVLSLNMLVSESASFPTCFNSPAFAGFTMTPTFNLAPLDLSSSPTNSGNGKTSELEATVTALGMTGSSVTLTLAAGPFGTRTLSATSNSSTLFQGISGFSALSAGMFVNVDGAIQSDGSLLATRIEVENPTALNLSTGPIMQVANEVPVFQIYGRTELGSLLTAPDGQSGIYLDMAYFDFTKAMFQISGQFTNLENLPFLPSFNAANMVGGQNVDVTSPAFSLTGGIYTPANTVTLIPQTIDGTVSSSSRTGNFTVYTVTLASYDLFPQLAVQPGQTTLLTNPNEVQVYVDSNTQMANTQSLAAGSTLRFYGLVFNDNGTLRMDCGQISDGVAQ